MIIYELKKELYPVYVIKILISILLLGLSSFTYAQQKNYSPAQLKELAVEAETLNDYQLAAKYYQAYLIQKPDATSIQFRLAESYRKIGAYSKAEKMYEGLSIKAAKKYPLAAFYLAEMLKAQDSCKKAIPIYEKFRRAYRGEKDDRKYMRLAKYAVAGCHGNSVEPEKLVVEALPRSINSNRVEGAPIFLSNDRIAFNSLPRNTPNAIQSGQAVPLRKFQTATRKNSQWLYDSTWQEMNFPTDMEVVNGAFNYSKDRFYFTLCESNFRGDKNCDLYYREKAGNSWGPSKSMGELINTKYLESQPAVGVDEKGRETVYFVSDRKEGKGGKDIWYTYYKEKYKSFSTPRNCGSKINSVGDELTPFVHQLNGKLYFSSNGHPGSGMLDVFYSTGQRSRWEKASNVGPRINGPQDELYYVLNNDGDQGIFASNRPHPNKNALQACCDDLFFFEKMENRLIQVKTNLKLEDVAQLKNSQLKLYTQGEDGELFFNRIIRPNAVGEFEFVLEPDQDYVIKAEAENHLSDSRQLSTYKLPRDKQKLDLNLGLSAIKDKAYRVENIYYEFGDDALTNAAFKTIDTTIYKIMVENPEIVVEIGSHTDNKGTEAYNEHLSQGRAESVVSYLRKRGISKERLRAKGYGESQPVAPNVNSDGTDNPEGRAKNRRTEFKVIGEINLVEEED